MEDQHQRPTILIVDDERGPRESLRMILKPAYFVLTAASGTDALETLRTTPVDLVTLDLNMPGMKGEELMRTVRREFPGTQVIVITGYGSIESASEGIRHGICDYLQKPFDVVKVLGAVTRALARQQDQLRLVKFLDALGDAVGRERDIHEVLADLEGNRQMAGSLGSLLSPNQAQATLGSGDPARTVQFLEVLAETIETKDRYMRGHARRVAYYAGLLADRLCLSAEERERIRISSFLHDVGKIGIPNDLMLRPGPLSPSEYKIVQDHPRLGAQVVEPLGLASPVVAAIHHHHEWWNGKGYPDGLKGEEIPLAARIIQVADAFDAMSCDRVYRPALAPEAIVRELREFAGVQFDPEFAKEFLVIVESGAGEFGLAEMADTLVISAERCESPELAAPSMQAGGGQS